MIPQGIVLYLIHYVHSWWEGTTWYFLLALSKEDTRQPCQGNYYIFNRSNTNKNKNQTHPRYIGQIDKPNHATIMLI